MRAAVIHEHGGPGTIRYETAYPDPKPAADEVVLKVGAATLNYHDIFTRKGMPGIKVPLPCIPGLDFAGEIVEVGPAVKEWKVGDRVMVDPVDRKGPGGLLGEMRPGGLAEFCAVPDHHLVRLPAEVSYEAAACLPVAYGTALRMMVTIGKVAAKEKVLILGASGGVGTCCVQLAKLAGAEVIAAASTEDKLKRLGELGADHLLDYKKHDFMKWVFEKFGKPHRRKFADGVDVVVNFTGGDTWVKSMRVLHRGGRLLTCGATAGLRPAGGHPLHLDFRAAGARLERMDARRPFHAARHDQGRQAQAGDRQGVQAFRKPTRRSACSKTARCSARWW